MIDSSVTSIKSSSVEINQVSQLTCSWHPHSRQGTLTIAECCIFLFAPSAWLGDQNRFLGPGSAPTMWCKAPSRPPLSPANVCGTVPRLSRGRGPPDYNEPGKRKGKTKYADKTRKEEVEGTKKTKDSRQKGLFIFCCCYKCYTKRWEKKVHWK